MKTKYKVLIIVVFVLVAIVLWAIAGSTNKSEQGNQDTSITLSDAQALIGMDCIGSEVSQECTWNETRYDFLIPGDWNSDRKKRVEACEQGYINEAYNFVTDGQTWYATANFEKENNVLMEAFQDIGFESEVASFCR